MSMQTGSDFNWIYERYLTWFHQNAKPDAKPRDQEALLGFLMCQENIFEHDDITLNQMFFIVPLMPSESQTGRLKLFTFSELNLLREDQKTNDIDTILPVQYMTM